MFNPDFKQARNEFLRKHRLILGWHNGIVAFLGFVFAACCGGLLAVPNALTAPEIGLFTSIEYAIAVGVFLMFVGVWGVCAVVRSSRYLLTLHSVVMMVVADGTVGRPCAGGERGRARVVHGGGRGGGGAARAPPGLF